MKKVKVKSNASMTVNLHFTIKAELNVPKELKDEELENYIKESNEWQKSEQKAAWPEGINFDAYDDWSQKDAWDDGLEIEEIISEDYLKGKKDLAKDILDKMNSGFSANDILDLIRAWGVEREDE